MTPESWQKIKAILDSAEDLPPGGREEFLAAVCNGDAELRQEVESFLAFEGRNNELLEGTAFSFNGREEPLPAAASLKGKKVGNYVILEELGSGGMGAVFLAKRADGAFDQKVALKLIKRGMDSDNVLQRFFNERRILASLKHPNIARLLDGGTTDEGVPYFVMEYVEGKNLLEYSDRTDLGLRERLHLFRDICSAVTNAHRSLIIHRDLKPSNILVTEEGEPKLLDFGIAKMLSGGSEGFVTATRQFILTPEYASPEQLRCEQLTTASDIYSLGVILYEFLTGVQPYRLNGAGFGEMLRIVCETEPVRASLVKAPNSGSVDPGDLRGDLDNIILKALRKEPERRYSSVEQFSGDIRNYLTGRPVAATRDSWTYRSRKFVRRHVYALAAALTITLSLIGGLGATLYQTNIARRERAKAEQRFHEIRQLTNSIMFEMNDKISESPIKARELLVTRALEYLDRLAAEGGDDPEIMSELGTAFEKIGQIQAEIFNPGLGRPSEALTSHQRALEIRQKLFEADKSNLSRGLDLIKSYMYVGDILSMSGRLGEARDHYRQAISLGDDLITRDPTSIEVKRSRARAYARFGQAVLRSGSLGDALENYQRSQGIYEEILAAAPEDDQAKRALSVLYSYQGYVKLETLEFGEAVRFFRNELAIAEQMSAQDPTNVQFRDDVNAGHSWLGVALGEEGKLEESLTHLNTNLVSQQSGFESDPANLGVQNFLADAHLEIAKVLTKMRRFGPALEEYVLAIKNYQAVWEKDQQNLSAKRQILLARRLMADSLTGEGQTQKALVIYLEAISDYEDLIRNDAENTEWQDDLAICHLNIGENSKIKDPETSLTHFRSAAAMFERLSEKSPENARIRRDLGVARAHISSLAPARNFSKSMIEQ